MIGAHITLVFGLVRRDGILIFVYCDYSPPVLGSEGVEGFEGGGEMAQLANGNEVVTPTEDDAALARESGERLAAHLGESRGVRLQVNTGTTSEELVLPSAALRLLVRALAEMGRGNAVALT